MLTGVGPNHIGHGLALLFAEKSRGEFLSNKTAQMTLWVCLPHTMKGPFSRHLVVKIGMKTVPKYEGMAESISLRHRYVCPTLLEFTVVSCKERQLKGDELEINIT